MILLQKNRYLLPRDTSRTPGDQVVKTLAPGGHIGPFHGKQNADTDLAGRGEVDRHDSKGLISLKSLPLPRRTRADQEALVEP